MTSPAAPAVPVKGTAVHLDHLTRTYGPVRALDDLELELAPGEMVVLLGPSGCGKTTALRALAGLEDVDSGRVVVGGRDVTELPTNKRDMGMVFQAYSLFPHLSALDNVAFGLRLRGASTKDRRRRAGEVLELVGLSAMADRYASELSGGQQQRVALARALAIEPSVLLLDEPLSALDAKVRTQLREEIRRIQQEVGTTTLFVTHDQEEALAVADRVGVMRAGRIEQIAAPHEVYSRPATAFVADFIGLSNQVPGSVSGGAAHLLGTRLPLVDPATADGPVTIFVRPEDVHLHEDDAGTATVLSSSFLGAVRRTTVTLPDGTTVVSQHASPLVPGDRVRVELDVVPVVCSPRS
ncbi:ABC transporter ATP-binding protein [Rhodococcus antarcticus]|jgi:putative spermidine/putrescine transport system ATP-binding protein|uniref:ABC transporter ATP-binding protein n=1 Tax=Rhodococcus antarcticus TaxID=2987751 RepID=A0ABY6P4P2_9NOCA|nr:ABC transporter ATP-binding protein [Rhodococcus antarcticus]UZJ26231.1 ABC transporter ATP-binding protein [Rhodococcus antarcticus]